MTMVRHRASLRNKDWSADDFAADLAGLGTELVSIDAYRKAVNYGRKAVPGTHRDDADRVVDDWVSRVQPYADDVETRIADELADAANASEVDEPLSAALDRIDAKLEALRSSVTRYAEPPWGAGWNGYGSQLEQRNILMVWVLDSADPCGDCLRLADGSPYETLPTWPGMGDTVCRDRCHCSVQADPESWDASLGDAA